MESPSRCPTSSSRCHSSPVDPLFLYSPSLAPHGGIPSVYFNGLPSLRYFLISLISIVSPLNFQKSAAEIQCQHGRYFR
ncbi:hypothetical protein MPTK1_7g19020 [Marchantia polymorpha subsp. ruderalis]|uniref:Uncharacterized protein n=2 Tax=Marchantia polymorpha TaxID=3197 RepID=A0AAF6C1A3_MARPO|nr:hypothetical protein MARPO_0067s0076 [Marchantia polymorpha]BBN18037.1 hypothetical protein Mp_7g19020 [Marchantia polymorpha subsp. ruderalis]|eukprot:PTQ35999.1 hypothetical protein MARPO_0067s0076 [Marchantia polymorpha]